MELLSANPLLSGGDYQPQAGDSFIAVMGPSGSGKTTFISHLVEKKLQKLKMLRIHVYLCHRKVSTGNVCLVDTPAFDNPDLADVEVLKGIAAFTCGLDQQRLHLAGIIYLQSIADTRMSSSTRKNLSLLKAICGEEFLEHVVLATTKWEQLDDQSVGVARETELSTGHRYWGGMLQTPFQKGPTIERHMNTQKSAHRILDAILTRPASTLHEAPALQTELTVERKTLKDTRAGRELISLLQEEKSLLTAEAHSLDRDIEQSTDDADLEQVLEQEKTKIKERLESLVRQHEEMETTMEELLTTRLVRPQSNSAREKTLWAATKGELSEAEVREVLKRSNPEDFEKTDIYSQTPLNYMQIGLSNDRLSETIWSHAVRLKGHVSQEIHRSLCRFVHTALDVSRGIYEEAGELIGPNTQSLREVLHSYTDLLPSVLRVLGEGEVEVKHLLPAEMSSNMAWVFQWEIPSVIDALVSPTYPVETALGEIITISGSDNMFECACVSRTLKALWPESISQCAVDIVQQILVKLAESPDSKFVCGSVVRGARPHGRASFYYFATHSVLLLNVNCSSCWRAVPHAISWLCAAVRTLPDRHEGNMGLNKLPCKSVRWSLFCKTELGWAYFVGLQPLGEELQVEKESACWLKLFRSVPVVERRVERERGIGLEIPFDLMVTLAAAENIWTIDGGAVLLGFFTALVPVEVWDSGIQWHFEEAKRDEKGRSQVLSARKLREQLKHAPAQVTPEELHGKTSYVGWFSNANIMLGTKSLVDSDWLLSKSEDLDLHEKTLDPSGYEAGAQTAFSGFPLVFKGAKVWEYAKHVGRREPLQSYRDALVCQKEAVSLAIDTGAERAWFVPLLSLLLHLCHRYYRLTSGNWTGIPEGYPIPFAEPSPDGAVAVIKAMLDAGDNVVLGRVDAPDAFRLSQLFHRLLNTIDDHPHEVTSSFVTANDLMDVVKHNPHTLPRKVPVNEDRFRWPDLVPFAEKADAVGVCENLGQAIEPDITMGSRICTCNCPSDTACCYALPEERGYLAAHMSSISAVCKMNDLKRHGECKISDAFWTVQHNPWEVAPHCNGVSIWANELTARRMVQETSNYPLMDRLSKGKGKQRAGPAADGPRMKVDAPENGVVVFGRWEEKGSNGRWLEKVKIAIR